MDSTCRTKTVQALNKAMEKETLLLTHKLQRPEGQWKRNEKSDLIDSLLRKYPIDPGRAIKEDGNLYVIDGVQRFSCIRDYLNNKFALSKNLESIIINGKEKNLSGLKFEKLDEDTKDALLNCELQMYELSDWTEKDVREIFRRQNAGKPLNVKHLRIVYESNEFIEAIEPILSHPFMNKLMTPTQRKNGTDRNTIIQTLMLICTNKNQDFTSFRKNDMDAFVMDNDQKCIEYMPALKETLDAFDKSFDKIRIQVTSMSMMLYAGYRVTKDKKSFSKFVDIVNEFLNEYDKNEEYKKFLENGTSSQENVRGRFDWWRNKIRVA